MAYALLTLSTENILTWLSRALCRPLKQPGSIPLTACVVCRSSGLTVWEPERTLLLSLLWLLSGEESHHLGLSDLCNPSGLAAWPLTSPGPSALRVSALPGKWRTQAGHLPASPGTLLSAQLRQIFPEPLPVHSAAGARRTRVYLLEPSVVEGTKLPSSD